MSTLISGAAIAVTAYLVGSIPSAYVIGQLVAGVDIRLAGEGNVGARNAFHVVGARWGVAVFLADVAKGAAVGVALRDLPAWQLAVVSFPRSSGHLP